MPAGGFATESRGEKVESRAKAAPLNLPITHCGDRLGTLISRAGELPESGVFYHIEKRLCEIGHFSSVIVKQSLTIVEPGRAGDQPGISGELRYLEHGGGRVRPPS